MIEPSDDGANVPPPSGDGTRRTRQWIVIAVVAGVVLVGGVIAVAASSGGGSADEGVAAGGSAITESPAPGASAGTSPEATPDAAATDEPAQPAPEPSLTWEPGAVDDALPLDDVATPVEDVSVRLVKLESVQGTAQGPGQVAGPALRITLELTNDTAEAIPLNAALVQAYCGPDRIPGDPLSGPGVAEFSGTLEPGDSATGVYVITCSTDLRDDVQITFGYLPAGAKVAFEGAAPRG